MNCEGNLSLITILTYCGDRKHCLVDGEQVLNAKHLVAVGIKTQTPTTYCIFGLCLQTSNLKGKPHEIEIELTSTGNISCKCSCKAGLSGFCKHSIALLLYINRSGLDNLSDISSTDVQQQWGQLKKTKRLYKPKPISEFCHVKEIKSQTSLQDFHRELCSCAPLSALAKHSVGHVMSSNVLIQNDQHISSSFKVVYESINSSSNLEKVKNINFWHSPQLGKLKKFTDNDLTLEEKNVYNFQIKLTQIQSLEICAATINQDCAKWLSERKFRITGSTCYELYTYGLKNGQSWKEKICKILNRKFKGNAATDYGKTNESTAVHHYSKITGKQVSKCGLIIPLTTPWLGFSPDGIILDRGKVNHFIEVKCPLAGQFFPSRQLIHDKKITYIDYNGQCYSLKTEHPYYGQCQLGIAILNVKYCDFIVYSKDELLIVNVKKNEEFIDELLSKMQWIYFKYFLPQVTREICLSKK